MRAIYFSPFDSFAIVADISHLDRTVDRRKFEDIAILVKKEGALIGDEVENNYVRVVMMYPSMPGIDLWVQKI